MSDLESFSPSEGSEGVDAGALERMREQMRAAAQAMQKDQKQEQKQKKSEDAMYQVLIMFIDKLGATHPIVVYIVRTLKDNLLSEIILTIISLNYPVLHSQVGLELVTEQSPLPNASENALIVPNLALSEMSLHLRLNLELWIKLINQKIFLEPVRNLQAIRNPKAPATAKHSFTDLMSYIAQDYLQTAKVDFNGQAIEKYIRALSANLIERLEAHLNSTPKISNDENPSQ